MARCETSGGSRRTRSGGRAVGAPIALSIVLGLALSSACRAATDTIVTIRGDVVPACSLAGLATSYNLGDLTASGSTTLAFATTCNAPFSYTLESAYGGLRHSSGPSAPAGFSAVFPYSVRAIIPTDVSTIDDTCTSASILAGATSCTFTDSGTGIAIGTASELQLGWTGVSNLLGGSYSDTLTLTVGIRP